MKLRQCKVAPYSLFRYRQVDGRIKFRVSPLDGSDLLLSNVAQMAVDHPPHVGPLQCNIVLISFDPQALITFDAYYQFNEDNYRQLIQKGIPIAFYIRGNKVFYEPLVAEDFFASY